MDNYPSLYKRITKKAGTVSITNTTKTTIATNKRTTNKLITS
jgi:hypothetical protein